MLGLARNRRLERVLGAAMREAHSVHLHTGHPARRYRDFTYRTRKSWSRRRRVVGKAEYLSKGANPRFVVTSLSPRKASARRLYENLYCARGDMENRIKEQQLDLFAGRTSTHTMRANQLRLYFSSSAYVLMHSLRQLGTAGAALARAQCSTLRWPGSSNRISDHTPFIVHVPKGSPGSAPAESRKPPWQSAPTPNS